MPKECTANAEFFRGKSDALYQNWKMVKADTDYNVLYQVAKVPHLAIDWLGEKLGLLL